MKMAMVALVLGATLSTPAVAQQDAGAAQVVTVQLSNFAFTPKHVVLQHGQDYVLHLVSTVGGGHDFTAPQFFAAAQLAPADAAKVEDGQVEVHGREAVDIRLTAPAAGTYPLHCSHFGHSLLGMTGDIVVR